MISYLMVGTNDLPRAVKYFGVLMQDLGATKAYDSATSTGWGWGIGTPMFIVGTPFDTRPASVGNGSMVSFRAESREKVDSLYAKALELGGTSEGEPGLRGETFYAAYFRDPDGNKFNFICYL
jgi:catechol 2,3-dioxygenase-like lactoylglutathione lyase family enzyme